MAKMLKRIAPVGIGLLLIILIAVTISLVKTANDRTPAINNADDVYVSYDNGKYEVTYEKLYTLMKNQYGLTNLINMVDEKLFADEVAKVDVNSEEYIAFLNEQIFGKEDISELDAKEAQKSWNDVIDSLRITGELTKAQAADSAYDKLDSAVWTKVKDYYKLSYAREEWAKAEYLKKYLENRENGELFDITKEENSTSSVEKYFEDNYAGKVSGFFIPFTSEESALAMMKKHGINTLDKVLSSNDGWVKDSYNYYEQAEVTEEDMLTYEEVVAAFVAMYNEVYAYLNNGQPIISADSYTRNLKAANTIQAIILAVQKSLEKKDYGMELTLPAVANVEGIGEATINWTVDNGKYATIESNVLKGKFDTTDDGELEITLNFEVKFNDESAIGTITIDLEAVLNKDTNEYESPEKVTTSIDPVTVDPFYAVEFTKEFLDSCGENFKFEWTNAEALEFNSTLETYLSVDSTKLKLSNKPAEIYKSYTLEPVKVGNYYFLIIKLQDHPQADLFKKDADGKNSKDENGKYIINDQEVYDEIIAKMTEELLTENAINEMLYEKRYAHDVKIFDGYLEALYEYEYKNFYETTIKADEYNEYKKTKKNKKEVILTLQTEAGNKKSVVEFTAQDLFNALENKYAVSSAATLIENYMLINNEALNAIYNPYTDTIINETSYKNLMNSELATLRKNFESDYFTYSYLSYYGFTPNFPAKYGWKKFIKDYFVVDTDQELLTSSTYGGTIYAEALEKYIDSLYDYAAIKAEMEKAAEDWYSVSVINLLVTIDYDYNADSSAENSAERTLAEKDNWTNESELATKQIALAKELTELMYKVANQTNGATLSDQLTALVTLYNEAAIEYNETEWNTAKANNTSVYDFNYFGKYKQYGLNVTFEKAATYDSTSSILEPFADECRKLWKEAVELGLEGETFDVPLIGGEAFYTDYGYHKIAVLAANKKLELPTQEEIDIHRAQALVAGVEEEIATVEKNIETYTASGYNISSYEAELEYLEDKLAIYEANLTKVLTQYGKDAEFELDEDQQAKIKQWYTNAETEIEGGTLVTRSYIKALTETASDIKFANAANSEKLAEFLELLLVQCDKADEE